GVHHHAERLPLRLAEVLEPAGERSLELGHEGAADLGAQGDDGGLHVEPLGPELEAPRLVEHDGLGALGLLAAALHRFGDDVGQVVDVVEVDVVEAVDRGLDVAGDGDVDEEEAPAPTRLHGRADHVEGDDEGLGGGAGDDDVGFDEAGGEVGKRAWRAAHLLGQELRALEAAVDDDELGAEADEELGGSFGHLARAEEDDRAAYELAENLLGQVDGDA